MSFLQKLLGNKVKLIFTKEGRVRHDHDPKKWEEWKNRFVHDPHYNWKNHTGMKGQSK
jgi:hypothetical protein